MGKTAFVFSGQGAQHPGMGKSIYEASKAAREVFSVSEGQRPGTTAQCFEGSQEELSLTVNTQPCLYTVDLAIARAVEERGIVPDGVAGFSLGEVAALTFSGVMSYEEGFALVVKRGMLMNDAAQERPGVMAAVMRLVPQEVARLAENCGVWPVNYNSPGQTVVAGSRENMAKFSEAVKAQRGTAILLKVSGAFHSPYMEDASRGLKEALKEVTYAKGWCPVYANVTAKPYPQEPEEAKALTALQVKSPVQWQKTVEHMIGDGFDTFIEVGAGRTLTGLIGKIASQVTAVHVENEEQLNEFKR